MIKLFRKSAEARFDVAQRLAAGELREEHDQKLIPAGEGSDPAVAVVAGNALVELVAGEKIEKLSENESAGVHAGQHRQAIRPDNEAELAGRS